MAFCATDENEHGEFVARAGISTINMYVKTTLWCSGIMQCLALSKVTRWSNAGVRASSVHDHFGTYHFGTGFSPNSKCGPLRYIKFEKFGF